VSMRQRQKIQKMLRKIIIKNKRFLLLGFLTSLLLALSYPKFNLGFLAFFAFAPFVYALTEIKKRSNVFLFGLFSGFIFHLFILYWIYFTCRAGGVGIFISLLAWIALAAILSIEWGLFALLASFAKKNKYFPLSVALCWVIVEWLKIFCAHKIVWFPWFLAGYTQWNFPPLIQIASVTGVFGVSFLLVLFGAGLGYAVYRKNFKHLIMPSVLISLVLIFGFIRISFFKPSHDKSLKVVLLQTNVNQYKKWTPEYVDELEANLTGFAYLAKIKKVDLVVYPEASLPGYIEEPRWSKLVKQLAAITNTAQLISTVSDRNGKQYVSVFMFDADGKNIGRYDKQYLVPFGEYIPFGFLTKYIKVLGTLGGFDSGGLNQKNIKFDDVNLAVGICYETIFTYGWHKKVKRGANLLVNSTNDGWYLSTAGPYQHFVAAVFRAVETKRPLIRCANTGISAYIDEFGKIKSATALNEKTILTVDVKLSANPRKTFYTNYGNAFIFLCMGMLTFLIFKKW